MSVVQDCNAVTIGIAPRESLVYDTDTAYRFLAPVLVRFLVYAAALAGLTALLVEYLIHQVELNQRMFLEGMLVENLQLATLLAGLIVMAATTYRHRRFRTVSVLLLLLFAMALVRELDAMFDRLLGPLGWQLPAGLLLLAVIGTLFRHWAEFWKQAVRWGFTPAFGTLWAGVAMVTVFAQIFGQSRFWRAVMGDEYKRRVKDTVEESIELLGYCLLLIAAIETWFCIARLTRGVQRRGMGDVTPPSSP